MPTGAQVSSRYTALPKGFASRICRNEGDLSFDIVSIYGENPCGTVPTSSFPGSRDCVVRSMVLAVLPEFT